MVLSVTDPLVIAPDDPVFADLDNKGASVPCNSSGVTTDEQSVETHVAMYKGNSPQTISAIACKIGSYPLSSSYAAAGSPTPAVNFKVSTTPSTGYVKVFVKSGTSMVSPTVITITVTATVDGETVSRDVSLTVSGNRAGTDGKDVFAVSLEKQGDVIALDADGYSVGSYDKFFKVRAYYGSTNVLSECTISESHADSDIEVTLTAFKTSGVEVKISDGTSLSVQNDITLTVTHPTFGSRTVVLTLTAVKAGKPALSYGIHLSTNTVSWDKDYAGVLSFKPSNYELSLVKTEGDVMTKLGSVPSGYMLEYNCSPSVSSGDIAPGTLIADDELNISGVVQDHVDYVLYKGTSAQNRVELQRIRISTVRTYQRMLVPAGEYSGQTEYTRTDRVTPLVHRKVTGVGSEYWYLDADTNVSGGTHIAPSDSNTSVWKRAENFEVLLTRMLFADFARLGSFIVYGNYFLSQYGVLVDGSGNETLVDESNFNASLTGPSKIVLKGNGIASGLIVCKVTFTVAAVEGYSTARIKVKVTPDSESLFDFGAVGKLDGTALESATAATIKSDNGTRASAKASGTTPAETTFTVGAGTHFIEIAYAKNNASDVNGDKASFAFTVLDTEGARASVTWDSVAQVKASRGMTFEGNIQTAVPYGWFDPDDPMASTAADLICKFRPVKCVNALTGEEWLAGGSVHLSPVGDASFEGTVKARNLYHGVCILGKASNAGGMRYYYCTQGFIDFLENYVDDELEYPLQQYAGNFTVGGYYTWQDVQRLTDYNSLVGDTGLVICTYDADIIVVQNAANNTGEVVVTLPKAADFDGKMVEIVDTRYTQPSTSSYVGALKARQCDGGNNMMPQFGATPTNIITLNGNYDHDGRTVRLLSYDGCWIALSCPND